MKKPEIVASQRKLSRRGLMLLGLQMAAVGGLGYRMRQLQVEEAATYRLLAEENRINIRLIAPARGLIFDRNGHALAENRQNYRVKMIREQARDTEAVLDDLAKLIPMTPERREKALKDLRQNSAFVEVTVAEHLTWEEIARVATNAPALPGVYPDVGLTRHYPRGLATAHVVGYVGPVSDRDLEGLEDPDPLLNLPDFQIGKTGVETRREGDLRGQAGASRIEVNAAGRVMRELQRTDGTPGDDMHLTLDADLQSYALERMAGESSAAVVLDIDSGDILVSASAPSFDPNAFVFGISVGDWNALLNNIYRPLSNKPVSGAYPPGSTFKMVVALAAAEAGISPQKTVWCPGHYQLGRRRFHCWRGGGHGWVDMKKSLKESCDVYYYDIAREIGIERITAMARRLGLGTKYDLPIPAITEGLTPTKEWKQRKYDIGWLVGDTLNAGIGQGFMLASPLQLAVMTARIASGKAVEPRIVLAENGRPVPVAEAEPLGISDWALGHVRNGMYAVVNEKRGTGRRSRIADPDLKMAGKTGTSQVRIITPEERARGVTKNKDLPWERRDHALFVCYAPHRDPKYAVSVVVEHGGGGSVAAAPIARDIMMRCLYGPEPPLAAYPPGEREEVERARAERARQEPEAPAATDPEGRDRA